MHCDGVSGDGRGRRAEPDAPCEAEDAVGEFWAGVVRCCAVREGCGRTVSVRGRAYSQAGTH